MGWRYLVITLGALTMAMFFLRFVVFRFKESPKFLVYQGREADAVKVLEHIARMNKTRCTLTLDDLSNLDEQSPTNMDSKRLTLLERMKKEFKRVGILFSTFQQTRVTILVWLTYICDFWGFTLAGKQYLACIMFLY